MQFKAASNSSGFKLIHFPNAPEAVVRVASNTTAGQNLAFNISGEAMLESGGRALLRARASVKKAPLAALPLRLPTTVPAEDWVPQSMLPIHYKNIDGGF